MLKHNSKSTKSIKPQLSNNKFTKFIYPFQLIFRPLLKTLSFFNAYKQIKYLLVLKKQLQSKNSQAINNTSNQEAQNWLKYSKDMNKRSYNALLYIIFVALWFISSLMLSSIKLPFWVPVLQLYFLIILSYYFIMCRYRSYQGNQRAKQLSELSFSQWFSSKIKLK